MAQRHLPQNATVCEPEMDLPLPSPSASEPSSARDPRSLPSPRTILPNIADYGQIRFGAGFGPIRRK
jgi:hypothetical protein